MPAELIPEEAASERRERLVRVRPAGGAEDPFNREEEAGQRRDTGDVGDPQAVRRCDLETARDPIRGRPDPDRPARRARPATPAPPPAMPRRTHHLRHPLAAHRGPGCRQFRVDCGLSFPTRSDRP